MSRRAGRQPAGHPRWDRRARFGVLTAACCTHPLPSAPFGLRPRRPIARMAGCGIACIACAGVTVDSPRARRQLGPGCSCMQDAHKRLRLGHGEGRTGTDRREDLPGRPGGGGGGGRTAPAGGAPGARGARGAQHTGGRAGAPVSGVSDSSGGLIITLTVRRDRNRNRSVDLRLGSACSYVRTPDIDSQTLDPRPCCRCGGDLRPGSALAASTGHQAAAALRWKILDWRDSPIAHPPSHIPRAQGAKGARNRSKERTEPDADRRSLMNALFDGHCAP